MFAAVICSLNRKTLKTPLNRKPKTHNLESEAPKAFGNSHSQQVVLMVDWSGTESQGPQERPKCRAGLEAVRWWVCCEADKS